MSARLRLASALLLWAFAAAAGAAIAAGQEPASAPVYRSPLDVEPAQFLDDVSLLITDEEREAFAALQQNYQQRAFIRRFWEVRDPYPQTARNELAERWYERLTLARQRYRDLADDRAQILLWNGDPERIVRLRCAEHLKTGEIWTYRQTDSIPAGFVLVFVTTGVSEEAPHRLWSGSVGWRDLFAWRGGSLAASDAELLATVREECPRGNELLDLLSSASSWDELVRHFGVVPQPNPEWVRTFAAHSTEIPDGAGELAGEVEVRFGGRNQSRTIVDATVLVDPAELPAPDDPRRADLVMDGEVLRGDELFEHFRYRFDRPADPGDGNAFAFSARRYLRPGDYRLILRLLDSATGRYFRSDATLAVPAPGALPADSSAAVATPPAAADDTAAAAAAAAPAPAPAETAEPSLRLLAPIDRLISGRVKVEADIRGFEPARVEFALDDQLLLARRRGPFSVDLDLGRIPRMRRIAARAFDDAGVMVAEDEIVLNGGPHRFAVRIVEPEKVPRPGERMIAKARVDLPEGEQLERLEFFVDDVRLATLYQPPFTVALAAGSGRVSYLRAVAYLADGVATEDVRLLA
ncbi:MAG: GWxTD domain-containing protein, partial [Thermoanaerobaculia bacterium]